jgi:hypothetical protein
MASTEFSTRSNKSAAFLFLLGFGLVAAGAAFAFAPQYSWQVTKIARLVNGYGLQNGALVVGGLVVFGLALVARAASAPAPTHDPRGELEALQSELHLFNEQVSTKMAQLRTAIMQVQEGLTSVASQQQAQMQQDDSQMNSSGNQSQDAVFRLAASLDKLHAHLDERVHAVDLQLRNGFEALLNANLDVRRHLEMGVSHPVSQTGAQLPHHGHAHAPSSVPESGIDFFETMQKLDAIAGGDVGQPAQPSGRGGRQPQAPFPSPNQGQGLGESLDALLPEEYRDRY